jgi:hypothetical protein
MRRPDQPELFAEIVETVRTGNRTVECSDGGWASYRVRPAGAGWFVLRDRDRHTVWTRRRPAVHPNIRRKRRWLP